MAALARACQEHTKGRLARQRSFLFSLSTVFFFGVAVARADPVTLNVTLKITDLEHRPIANVPVRVVFGSASDWQVAGTGQRVVTDAKGEAAFMAGATLDARPRKYPTNYAASLTASPQPTDHLRVAAELPFADFQWLYVTDLYRFRQGGDTLSDGLMVYTADERGSFVHKAQHDGRAWKMRDLGGMMLTHPGYDLGDFTLAPDPVDPKRWTLKLTYTQSPPPVRR